MEEGTPELLEHFQEIMIAVRTHRLSNLPVMTDKAKLQTVHWLDRLFGILYVSADARLPLTVFRSLSLTLEYGISAYSSVAFAQTAIMVVTISGDFQTAAVYSDLALEALALSDTEALAARTLFLAHFFIFSWTRPLKNTYDPLLEAYAIGNRTSDTENMSWAIVSWLVLRFQGGAPLDALQVDLERLMSEIKVVKNFTVYTFMQPVYQTVLNLIAQYNLEDPTSLVGIALSNEVFESCLNDPYFTISICFRQLMLLTYFGEHVKHAGLLVRTGVDSEGIARKYDEHISEWVVLYRSCS